MVAKEENTSECLFPPGRGLHRFPADGLLLLIAFLRKGLFNKYWKEKNKRHSGLKNNRARGKGEKKQVPVIINVFLSCQNIFITEELKL